MTSTTTDTTTERFIGNAAERQSVEAYCEWRGSGAKQSPWQRVFGFFKDLLTPNGDRLTLQDIIEANDGDEFLLKIKTSDVREGQRQECTVCPGALAYMRLICDALADDESFVLPVVFGDSVHFRRFKTGESYESNSGKELAFGFDQSDEFAKWIGGYDDGTQVLGGLFTIILRKGQSFEGS